MPEGETSIEFELGFSNVKRHGYLDCAVTLAQLRPRAADLKQYELSPEWAAQLRSGDLQVLLVEVVCGG